MLIALAAAAVAVMPFPEFGQTAAPRNVVTVTATPGARLACAAGVITTAAPVVRYDRQGADPGSVDRQPDTVAPLLFSAVESRIDGCSLPVVRVRAHLVQQPAAVPLDR